MPRDGRKVARNLQTAALDLFCERGYEPVTAAEIAARAGVTERTFFRHFADKRDVLFGGETTLINCLETAVRDAPARLGPWEVLLRAFEETEPLFIENRAFAEPRHRLIESTPALRERALAKTALLIAGLTDALSRRGVPKDVARLAAQIGMAVMSDAVACWFADDTRGLSLHIAGASEKVRNLLAAIDSNTGKKPMGNAKMQLS